MSNCKSYTLNKNNEAINVGDLIEKLQEIVKENPDSKYYKVMFNNVKKLGDYYELYNGEGNLWLARNYLLFAGIKEKRQDTEEHYIKMLNKIKEK